MKGETKGVARCMWRNPIPCKRRAYIPRRTFTLNAIAGVEYRDRPDRRPDAGGFELDRRSEWLAAIVAKGHANIQSAGPVVESLKSAEQDCSPVGNISFFGALTLVVIRLSATRVS